MKSYQDLAKIFQDLALCVSCQDLAKIFQDQSNHIILDKSWKILLRSCQDFPRFDFLKIVCFLQDLGKVLPGKILPRFSTWGGSVSILLSLINEKK